MRTKSVAPQVPGARERNSEGPEQPSGVAEPISSGANAAWITRREVERRLGCSRAMVRKLSEKGRFERRLGADGRWRFDRRQVETYAASKERGSSVTEGLVSHDASFLSPNEELDLRRWESEMDALVDGEARFEVEDAARREARRLARWKAFGLQGSR